MATTSTQPAGFENVSLFASCALPGCGSIVAEWGDVCTECVAAVGDYLRPSSGPRLTEDDIGDRNRQGARRAAGAAFDRRHGRAA